MASSGVVKTGVVLGGITVTILAFMVLVELLQFWPMPEVAMLKSVFWDGRPPAINGLQAVMDWLTYYGYVIFNVWLLLLVPVIGVLVTRMLVLRVSDNDMITCMERVAEQDRELAKLMEREQAVRVCLERTEAGFETLVQQENSYWIVLDKYHNVVRLNVAAMQFLRSISGVSTELEGRKLGDLWPGWVNTPLYRVVSSVDGLHVMNNEVEVNQPRQIKLHAWVWPLGEHVALLLQDITYLYLPENAKENSDALVRQLVEGSVRPLAVMDTEGRYLYVASMWPKTLGVDPQKTVAGAFHALAVPNFPANFTYALQQLKDTSVVGGEEERYVVNGQEEIFSWYIRHWRDAAGRVAGYVFNINNVTELVKLRAQVKDADEREHALAYSDMLTGLPNRQLFNDRLNMALAQAYRQLGKVALLFLDLDGFKAINDNLGHDAGDLLLKQVAERLKNCVRQTDTVARLGGDEFTIILHIRDKVDAERVAEKILATIRQPYDLAGQEGAVGTSIGIALYPEHATQAADLVRMADAAMYNAKQSGKNTWRFYTSELKNG